MPRERDLKLVHRKRQNKWMGLHHHIWGGGRKRHKYLFENLFISRIYLEMERAKNTITLDCKVFYIAVANMFCMLLI